MSLKKLIELISDTDSTNGDVYETGTWRAGTSMFMVAVFRAYASLKGRDCNRHFYFFDSFEGFRTSNRSDFKSLDTFCGSS